MDITPICMGDSFEPSYDDFEGVRYLLKSGNAVKAVVLDKGSFEIKPDIVVGVQTFAMLPFVGKVMYFSIEGRYIFAHVSSEAFSGDCRVRIPVQYLTPINDFDDTSLAHQFDWEILGSHADIPPL